MKSFRNSEDGLSAKVLAEYLTNPTDDELVLVNHQTGTIHYFDDANTDQLSISKWIIDCLNGNQEPISKAPLCSSYFTYNIFTHVLVF